MIGLGFYGLVASTYVLIHQVQETGEGKVPGSLQLQNLCSVTVVYPVDRPGGPVDRRHCVRFSGT